MIAQKVRTARIIPLHRSQLAQKIDDLADLRTLLAQAQATRRTLAGEILTELAVLRVLRFDGTRTVAIVDRGAAVTLRIESRSAARRLCSCCHGPREPLLDFEVNDPHGRAQTELCRACFAGEVA